MNLQRQTSHGTSCRGRAVGHNDATLDGRQSTTGYRKGRGQSTEPFLPIYVDGRTVGGCIVFRAGRRVLRKTKLRHDTHFCRKHGGYGCEVTVLEKARRYGVESVQLVFEDSERVLEAPLSAFAQHARRDSLGGFGEQDFLPLRYWRDLSDPQGSLFEAAEVSER